MNSNSSRGVGWVAVLMPYSIAIGPLGTLITLEVASLRGSPVELGYAMSTGSAVGVLAPLVWGLLLDRYDGRRILTLGFLGTAISIIALAYAGNIPQVALYYASSSLFSSAVGVASSVILVGSTERARWNESYSRLNLAGSLGYLVGDLTAAALAGFMSVKAILMAMGVLPIASALWSLKATPAGITRPKRVSRPTILNMGVGGVGLGDLALLYLALIIFYVSSGIFNTLYPYGLREGGLSKSWVMAIISAGMGVQIIGFRAAPSIISRLRGNARAASLSLILRGSSYMAIGLLSTTQEAMIAAGLVFYPLAAGLAYATFYTASSVMVFERIRDGEWGRGIGLYSVISGTAYFAGSLASGYLAEAVGFGGSYVAAGAMLMASAYIFNTIDKAKGVLRSVERVG